MGRQQHLTRLALGRSPFQDAAPQSDVASGESEDPVAATAAGINAATDHDRRSQQFDDKGRPVNPLTESRNASLRNAQNAVLALVGVVESRDKNERLAEIKHRSLREARQELLKQEQDRGEDLHLIANLLELVVTWWPKTLVAKAQAGLYAAAPGFVGLLASEQRKATNGGSRNVVATLFAGFPAHTAFDFLKLRISGLVEECVSRLQDSLVRSRLRRTEVKSVNTAILWMGEALMVALDIVLLPLEYYVIAQRLGLAPTWPLMPGWGLFSLSDPSSVHTFGWKSPFSAAGAATLGLPVLSRICAPAVLLIVQNMMKRRQNDQAQIGDISTRFDYPPINAPSAMVTKPLPTHDPFGWVLYRAYILRTRIMKWCGWDLQYVTKHPLSDMELENNCNPQHPFPHIDGDSGNAITAGDEVGKDWSPVYRSTSLAHLPVAYLARAIDDTFEGLILLPFECIVMRSVATSYLASPLPTSSAALSLTPLNPFTLFNPSSLKEFGSYLSKVGLSLALVSSVQVGIFFFLYRLTRWQGLAIFEWGETAQTGAIYGIQDGATRHLEPPAAHDTDPTSVRP